MINLKSLVTIFALGTLGVGMQACKKDSDVENTVEDASDSVGDAAHDAGDATSDAVKDAAE